MRDAMTPAPAPAMECKMGWVSMPQRFLSKTIQWPQGVAKLLVDFFFK